MKTKNEVEAFVDEYIDNNWLYMLPEGSDEFARITDDNIPEAAKHYGVPEKFLEMLHDATRTMANEIIGALHMDLEDIWKKVSN
jgi:hypothetical protein